MARRSNPIDLAKALPLPAVLKREEGEGEVVNPFDLTMTWKVKAEEAGHAFSVYEMTMEPGNSIPIHVHPFPEFFYVLDGQLDAMGLDADGQLTWTPLHAGACASAPSTAAHGLKNRSSRPATFLSVSTIEHEKSFNDYQALLRTERGRAMSDAQKNEALMDIFAGQKIVFLDVPDQ